MSSFRFPDVNRAVHDVVGLPLDAVNLGQAVSIVLDAVATRAPMFVSTPNLNFLIAAQHDKNFKQSIFDSDLSLADGMPIVWIAKIMGVPIPGRVAGSDLFEALREQRQRTVKVYFFGGPDGAAEQASKNINSSADLIRQSGLTPGVVCVGFDAPGFGTVEQMSTKDTIQRINDSGADFVLVALGARKGQAWIQHNRAAINAPVISHLGAVVNMVAETIQRAPRWMQIMGLEWIWRVKEEPLLWRRYVNDGFGLLQLFVSTVFPCAVARWKRNLLLPFTKRETALRCHHNGQSTRVQLIGDWTGQDLPRLVDVLKECHREGRAVEVDTKDAHYMDSAVRGMLLFWPTVI